MTTMKSERKHAAGLRLATNDEMAGHVGAEASAAECVAVAARPSAATDEALLEAVRDGDFAAVESLLCEGADVNAVDAGGWTALMWATVKGHAEIARALLNWDADVDARNDKGWTALRFAVSLNDTELALPLVERGADVNNADHSGVTPLMQAAGEKSVESVKLLLAHGADPNLRNHAGETALARAARHGYAEVVECLLDAGAVGEEARGADDDADLFSEGELQRLMEKLDGLVPRPEPAEESTEVLELAQAPAPLAHADTLERLAAALEALRHLATRDARHVSVADLAHKLTLSLPEAAALSGLSRRQLREAMVVHRLEAMKTGRGWRIKRADLEAYVASL